MKFKNFVLGIGILVVYALALWQGIQAFYPSPQYEDYCDFQREFPSFQRNVDCSINPALENKANACWQAGGEFRYEYDEDGCQVDGYCDECRITYDEASDKYSRNVFIASLIIGVITLIIGFTILSIEPVGSALMASGIWAFFFGTVVNWRNFGNSIRFVILAIVLILLILFAIRLNSKKKSSFLKKLKFWK